MSSTNIYLVTIGDYSDYRVVAAYSSKEKAQAYIDAATGPDGARISWPQDYSIETYPIDPPHLFGFQIHLTMARNGIVTYSGTPAWTEDPKTYVIPQSWGDDPNLRRFTVATDSAERAVIIANDMRAQMIARGEWPE